MKHTAELTREVKIVPGYDWRDRKPNYGQHPPKIFFIVKDEKGATVLQIATGWYINTPASDPHCVLSVHRHLADDPTADESAIHEHCEIINDACVGECYYASSKWLQGLKISGGDWLWRKLEAKHMELFHNGPEVDLTPEPREFPTQGAGW